MTHATKKILALVLTFALCLSLVVAGIPASAEGESLTIASVEAAPGEEVDVAVTAVGLPLQGGTQFTLNLGQLTFVSLYGDGEELVEDFDYSVDGNSINVLGLYGFDGEDLPAVLTLTVEVPSDAEADEVYPITATDVILADGDEILLNPVITNGGVTVVVDEAHEHNYVWHYNDDEHWKTCEGEGTCDEPEIDRAGHEWGDGVVTTAPTVLAAGERTFTCECGATKTEEEPKLTAPTTGGDVAIVEETDGEIVVDAGDADTVTLTDVIAVAGDKAVAVKTATAAIVFEDIEATAEVAFNVVKTEDAEIAGKTGTNFAFTMNNATFINATITVEYPVTANTKLYHIYGDPVQAEEIVFTDNGDGTATFELPHFSSVLFEEKAVAATLELYSITKPYGLVKSIDYKDLSEVLAVTYDYAMGYVDGTPYDASVILKNDVALTADAEVTSYTVLSLGDYTIDLAGYEFKITGSGKVTANYELHCFDNNPLVSETVSKGVYSYQLSIKLCLDEKNLTLSDNIFMNFTASFSNTSAYTPEIKLTYYKVTDPTVLYTSDDLYAAGKKSFTSATEGIPARFMGVDYVAVYSAKVNIGGDDYYVYSNTVVYSIVTYAKNMMNTNAKTKNLLVAMLNYGAAAQMYYDFDTEHLANDILLDSEKVLPENYTDYLIPALEGDLCKNTSSSGAYVANASLELRDAINIKYSLDSKSNKKTYKLCVWTYNEYAQLVDGLSNEADISAALCLENCDRVIDIASADKSVLLTGISAKRFANTYVTRLVEINGESAAYDWVWYYSPIQYCINKINAAAPETDLGKAMAVYSAMARAYFNNYTINSD